MLEYVGSVPEFVAVLDEPFVVGEEAASVDVTARPPLLVPVLTIPAPVLSANVPVTKVLGATIVDPSKLIVVVPISTVTGTG